MGLNGRLKLDSLIRVSQLGKRDPKDLRSPDQQRQKINDWIARNDAQVVHEHVSVGLSGKTVMGRSDITAVLERIRDGLTQGLIVAYGSRATRARTQEALDFKDAVLECGGRLVLCDMGGEYADSAMGEFQFTILAAVARLEWRQTKDRYEVSVKDAIARGLPCCLPSFGYARGADGRLVPNEHADVVRELFERKTAGATWLELARYLDAAAPRDKPWIRRNVQVIIKNKTYLGQVHHGQYVNASAHTPLVSASLWRRAQSKPGRRTPRGTYLLSGVVYCKYCERRMRGDGMGKRNYRVYKCINPDCTQKVNISCKRLDDHVAFEMLLRKTVITRVSDVPPGNEHAQAEVDRLTQAVEMLAQVRPTHPVALVAHQEALSEAERELEVAEDHLAELDARKAQMKVRETVWDYELWYSSTLEQQRGWMRIEVNKVTVGKAVGSGPASRVRDRVEIAWKDDLEDN